MTHLDDAHAALQRAVAAEPWEAAAYARVSRDQAAALLDEAARLVAERDAAVRDRDEARASEREACVRYLRAMAATWDQADPRATERDREVAEAIRSLATEVAEEAHAEWRRENRGDFELVDGMVLARLSDQRDDLREVLRPLLTNPIRSSRGEPYCLFCTADDVWRADDHSDNCPTRRAPVLLGEEAAS